MGTRLSDIGCCGRIHCTIVDGTAICDGGEVCAVRWQTFPCGDIVVTDNRQCQCGDRTIMYRAWLGWFKKIEMSKKKIIFP